MIDIVQKGYRNPTTGFPDYQYRGKEFDKMKWDNEQHDTDGDGVPNYLDADPLNASPGTWGMGINRQPQQPLNNQLRQMQQPEEIQMKKPTPKRKKSKKSKKKK